MDINANLTYFARTPQFPAVLTLSKDIVGDFYRAWEDGERRAIEVGYNMLSQNGALSIHTSQRFDGAACYTAFPVQRNFLRRARITADQRVANMASCNSHDLKRQN